MILSDNSRDAVCSTFNQYEEYDSHYITRSASIVSDADPEDSNTNHGHKLPCGTENRDEEDEYRIKTDRTGKEDTEDLAYSQYSSSPVHSLEHEELEEDFIYNRSISSSLRDLEQEDEEGVGHYDSDMSCAGNGISEDRCWDIAFRSSPSPNLPQQIDFSLKRANPVYDEDSDTEVEQEEYRHLSKRNRTIDYLST